MIRIFWYRIILVITILLVKYNCDGQDHIFKINTGEYINTLQRTFTLKFLPNKGYAVFDDSTNIYESWGKATYNIFYKNDTSFLTVKYPGAKINGVRMKRMSKRSAFWLDGDYLTIFNYKEGKGIANHIDEYAVFVKKVQSPQKIKITHPKISYIIPRNLKGTVWIAFNQADGIAPEYDNLGNATLKIPESGLLRTSIHEDVYATANKYYYFLREDGKCSMELLKVFDKYENFDSTCCIDNKPIVLVYGYNQTSREDINNNIFKRDIVGNVLSFYFGSYKDIEENRYFSKEEKLCK